MGMNGFCGPKQVVGHIKGRNVWVVGTGSIGSDQGKTAHCHVNDI